MSPHTTADHVCNTILAGLEIAKRTYASVEGIQVGYRGSIVLLTDTDGSFFWSASAPKLLTMNGEPGAVCRAVAEYAGRKLALSIVG
jgi:hypothetical protein